MSNCRSGRSTFEWRVSTARWRWLMLGTLGVATPGCSGHATASTEPTGGPDQPSDTGNVEDPTHDAGLPVQGPDSGGPQTATTGFAFGLQACTNPTPVGGGWAKCSNGVFHRAALEGQCSSSVPRAQGLDVHQLQTLNPGYDPQLGNGADYGITCLSDGDCTAHPFGHCETVPSFGGTTCAYGCVTDADCPAGPSGTVAVCLCREPVGQCVSSKDCVTDADCVPGLMCSVASELLDSCSFGTVACQTPADTCATDADCKSTQPPLQRGYRCRNDLTPDHANQCGPFITYSCGRPFLVEGCARVAVVEQRADWYGSGVAGAAAPPALPADRALRAAVARGWLEQALMEHASVAAFARFSLQLLGLGAPAELVAEAAAAQQDEIVHARDCFGLARRYSDSDLGPGPLALSGTLVAEELRAVVLGTIAEGCVGETVAALEAAEALAHCSDEPARAVLERIAADETRHAQLAWRFVAWALEQGPASLRGEVEAAFARELALLGSDPTPIGPSAHEQQLLRHGLLGPALRDSLRRRVLADVIAPCAAALVGPPSRCMLPAACRRSTSPAT